MKRGEVWLCTLDPTVGHEIRKARPCLIVSPDDLNQRLSTLIVAPLTSGSQPARFRVNVTFRGKDGLILPDQLRTLDRRRFVKQLGTIHEDALADVQRILIAMFS
ncbi:type II toxin-antitoxin system PemK/MazF family toxin [uncultured Sphingomonas sp.]|uniref:type II toxin-antitoxin system PemK/MazF family toxin n=1 Tax=uncultured Sphingomonas sp. TaxID=158754 RepID=UPI0025E10204|nr:type II toxin-antitoxin system PemK/MazF family toxin [uncultured Sphingomonas sp.]